MLATIYSIPTDAPGRLAIIGRPRSGEWLSAEIADWKSAGLTDVVSLLEAREARELELTEEAAVCEGLDISFETFPIPDRGVPSSVGAALGLWDQLAMKVRNGHSIGLHCRAGIGRSGLMAAGLLVRLGVLEHDAWRRVSIARGVNVPDTDEQRSWLSRALR
jgi:protein-tyrosine phosphatase